MARCDDSLVTTRRGQRRGGVTFRPCRWPSWGLELEAVLVAHGVCLGAAGVGLVREAGAGGLGPEALVAAPGALVGGVVVVVGVRATHPATGAAPGAGPAGAGVRRRLMRVGALALAVGLVLVGAAPLLLALPLAVLFLAAFAGAIGGGAAGAGAEAALAAGVVGLGEGGAAVGAVGVDAGHHRFVTSWATGRPPGAGVRVAFGTAGQGRWSVRRRLRGLVASSHRLAAWTASSAKGMPRRCCLMAPPPGAGPAVAAGHCHRWGWRWPGGQPGGVVRCVGAWAGRTRRRTGASRPTGRRPPAARRRLGWHRWRGGTGAG